jgi:hypothetical protein
VGCAGKELAGRVVGCKPDLLSAKYNLKVEFDDEAGEILMVGQEKGEKHDGLNT